MSKKILITHLAHWDQLLGGAELQLKLLSQLLVEHNFEVHFIFPLRNKKMTKTERIIEHPISKLKFPGTFGKTWFVSKKRVLREVNKIKPDIIITRTYSSWAGILANYSKANQIKHFHFIASDSEVEYRTKSKAKTKVFDRIEQRYFDNIFNRHTKIITQNDYQSKKIKDFFQMDATEFSQQGEKNKEADIVKNNDIIRITWIANFKAIKRPEKYLEIVRAFSENSDVQFTMIGGFKSDSYKSMIDSCKHLKNFRYLGELENEQVNEELNQSHILINTSDFEGFSNTFVQAWLRKVVVISLNSNPNNILTDQKIGFQSTNLTSMIKTIQYLMQNKDDLKNYAERSRKYAINNHVMDSEFLLKLGLL